MKEYVARIPFSLLVRTINRHEIITMIISITTYLFEVSAVSASYTQPCVITHYRVADPVQHQSSHFLRSPRDYY
jgi:hypothetical protein